MLSLHALPIWLLYLFRQATMRPPPRHDTGAVFEIFHPTGDFHFLGSKSHSGKCGCGHDYGKAKLGHRQTSIVSIGNFGL
jgi:hypothetical protein